MSSSFIPKDTEIYCSNCDALICTTITDVFDYYDKLPSYFDFEKSQIKVEGELMECTSCDCSYYKDMLRYFKSI